MSRNIKLVVVYDGSHYLGWQKTKMGPSIEGTLEKTLTQILQEKINLQAASRTDAGVHAAGQVVNFFSEKQDLDCRRLLKSLNGLLPKDISVIDAAPAEPDFHPTLDCKGKEYHYHICNSPLQLPFHRQFSWHYRHPLALPAMQKATAALIGTHDFSTFCNARALYLKDPTRTIYQIEIEPLACKRLQIRIFGPNFLYNMVRNIVGTLVYAGSGKISSDSVSELLMSRDRKKAGVTAPAHGLSLHRIIY